MASIGWSIEISRRRHDDMPVDTLCERLDAQYADLMERVWACERAARCEDRIDAVIRYGTYR
jgi:hypothetical protein